MVWPIPFLINMLTALKGSQLSQLIIIRMTMCSVKVTVWPPSPFSVYHDIAYFSLLYILVISNMGSDTCF